MAIEHAGKAGHLAEGLARNLESAAKVSRLGATPVLGDLQSFDVLAAAASRADAVLHFACIHDFGLDYSVVIDTEIDQEVLLVRRGSQVLPLLTARLTAAR